MSEVAELLRSIAPFLWPILALYVVHKFAGDISDLIARIKSATILGSTLTLHPDTQKLQDFAALAVDEAATLPRTTSDPPEDRSPTPAQPTATDAVESVLETAAISPTAGLLLLAREIEKEGRNLLASIGEWKDRVPPSFPRVIAQLDEHYDLPTHITRGLSLFRRTRNRLVHGGPADDREILSVLDSGISLYQTLKSLPRDRH